MSPVQNVWHQLVQRRLWPVAIVLVAALAAVPMLLAKDPVPAPAPPAPAADTSGGELASEPIVSLASTEPDTKRRKVLGSAKNPFRADPPKPETPAGGTGAAPAPAPSGGQTDAPAPGGGGDTSTPSSPSAPAAPVTPAEPAPKPKTYEPEELTIRLGDGEESGARRSLTTGTALPSEESPVLIYIGVRKDGKTAEFLLDAGVSAVGDGECFPNTDACETLRLRAGETEFLDVTDETGAVTQQFQLDLLKIHNVKRDAKASRARTKSVKASAASRPSGVRAVAGLVAARLP